MDLLCNAYNNSSDDEPETKLIPKTHIQNLPNRPPLKRLKAENYEKEAPMPGRYVSKREKALFVQPSSSPAPNCVSNQTVATSPVCGSIANSDIPHEVFSSLRQAKDNAQPSKIPERMSVSLRGHTKAVNALDWSQMHTHLLASAGMDHTICVWNVWSRNQTLARAFRFHNAPVKDVKWSRQGLSLLSCGYDHSSRLIDVEKGIENQIFKEDQVVRVVKFHPENSNLFLSGGSKGQIRLWDIRHGKVVHEYNRGLGPILDLEFAMNGKQFISACDVSGGNVSENSVIVWDVSRQVPLSNQVYVEAYTCPCIRYHPFDPYFVAQSNGNYIAIFTSTPPYRLDKYKRYEGHGVSGFPIKCNFSIDGNILVSGSSDGSMYFYGSRSSKLIRKVKAFEQACIDVTCHPILPNVVASCSWNGDVSVFE